MKILIDTGILLRLMYATDPHHSEVTRAVRLLHRGGYELVTTPQNIAEFWSVSTRPTEARGGYGKSVSDVVRCVDFFETLGRILEEQPPIYQQWRELVTSLQVSGKAVHDARIAASMLVAQVQSILTLNPSDFRRFALIAVHTPQDILAGRLPTSDGS